MQNNPSPQLPCKGILKTSRSFDKSGSSFRKSAKFDELNVLQTFHPSDKDYGHMKIDEPKTPYNYSEGFDENRDQLDAELLVEKLRIAQQSSQSIEDDTSDDDDVPESEEDRQHRREFELRRKAHYREFEAVKLARKLIQEEDDDDEDVDTDDNNKVTSSTSGGLQRKDDAQTTSQAASLNSTMEVEQILNTSRN